MKKNREQIEQAIAILEGQRAALGPAIVDTSIDALHKQLALLGLPAEAPVTQQRKQVTLLYIDVVGSTNIARHLDPEDVLEIMDGALKRLAVPVEAQGGHVTRFQGDGFKAVFGTPVAHEDDPERAVRAGLGILETAQIIAAELLAKHGIDPFTVRVGINTGLAMVGGQTEAEDTIMGEAVILAARMESAAPPGGLLISHHTYQHILDLFEVKTLEPILVKGFDQLVAVYQVIRSRPRPFWKRAYNVAGIATRMVGRDVELGRLQEAFNVCVEDHEPRLITLVGEPGIGKSRLLHEMTAWIELLPQGVILFRGRPDQEMQQRPYSLLRDLFSTRFDIQDSDPLPVVQVKFEHGIAAFGPFPEPSAQVRAHFIGQMLGFDFSTSPHLRGLVEHQTSLQQVQHRAQVYLRNLFASIAERHPVALLLEDIHWADDPSLDLVNDLLHILSGNSFFVIATARPSLYERRPHWGEGQTEHTRLDLSPLSRRSSRKMVEEILQKILKLPEALRELIVGNGEGNPFYLEELIKMMVEDGVIHMGEDQWQVNSTRLAQVRVPSTLAAVLQARFDSLPESEQVALQRASVMGRIFWDDALIHLSGADGCFSCGAALAALRGREMVFQRETSSVRGAQEYLFKHALLREATYESVLKRDRRKYHDAAARWLIERSQDRQSEFAGQIAEHLVRAGKVEEAVEYLHRAGEQAAGQFANDQAIHYFTEALDLLTGDAAQMRFNLLLNRARLFHRIGKPHQELEDVQALEALSANLGPEQQIQAAFSRAYACERQEDNPAQNRALSSAVELAQSIGRIDLEAEGFLLLGVLSVTNDESYTLQMMESALVLARQAGLKHLEPDIYKYQSMAYQNMNNHQAAFEAARMSCEISRALGDLYGEGRALAMMGNTISDVGDVLSAIQYERESQRICREAGNTYDEAWALMNIWFIYEHIGMWEHQAEMLRQGIEEIFIPRIHPSSQMPFFFMRAQACMRASDPERALVYAEKGLAICPDRPEDIGWFAMAKSILGEALAANSRDEEALACLVDAVKLYQGKQDNFSLTVLERLVRFLVSRHQINQALPYLEELYLYDLLEHNAYKGYFAIPAGLTCCQAFQAYGDPRADQALEKAHNAIEYFSALISDEEMRLSYQQNLPWNREVLRLWAELTES